MDLERTNIIKIVGRLTNCDIKTGNRKSDGMGYVSVTASVTSDINGEDNQFDVSFYAFQSTKDGKENSLYGTYLTMNELIGKKVQIDGSMSENRFYSMKQEKMASSQRLNGRFIKGVSEQTRDEATFELGGFIMKTLAEKTNKAGEVYAYELALGQCNYSGNAMSMLTVQINPNDREIVMGAKNYKIAQTVKVYGNLHWITTQVSQKSENVGGFGEAPVRVFTNHQRNFFMTGGTAPETAPLAYDTAIINSLIETYKAKDKQVELEAKSRANSGSAAPVSTEAPITQRQTSLI